MVCVHPRVKSLAPQPTRAAFKLLRIFKGTRLEVLPRLLYLCLDFIMAHRKSGDETPPDGDLSNGMDSTFRRYRHCLRHGNPLRENGAEHADTCCGCAFDSLNYLWRRRRFCLANHIPKTKYATKPNNYCLHSPFRNHTYLWTNGLSPVSAEVGFWRSTATVGDLPFGICFWICYGRAVFILSVFLWIADPPR